ncbi:MAG: hypothetical protein L0H59_18070, partial [Tomitella sp.]|nr:hypothetical protein [Tomitella sp.]
MTAPRKPRVSAGYRADWALFCDWCAAVGEDPLPAATATLVAFLQAHPAAAVTQRRRLTAIRAAHTRDGWPTPGLAATDGRFVEHQRAPAGRAQLRHVVAALPTAGWPAGLLGRRDALLLVLSQVVGLTFTQIERLQRSDMHVEHPAEGVPLLVVTTDGRRWQVPAEEDPRSCPVAVYLRWARLRTFFDKRPSTAALAAA